MIDALIFSISAALGPSGAGGAGGEDGVGEGVVVALGVAEAVAVAKACVGEGVVVDGPPLPGCVTRTHVRTPAKAKITTPAPMRVGNIQPRDFSPVMGLMMHRFLGDCNEDYPAAGLEF